MLPVWIVSLIKKGFNDRFKFARMTKNSLVGKAVEKALFDGDDMTYLPLDKVITINQKIADKEDVVLPSKIVEHFIEKAGVLWIMDECICRSATPCKDYPINLGCLFLGEAASGINPKLGRSVTKEEALDHAKKCREAGLVHLIGRNKLDDVWLGIGPKTKLLTICNCCPCCCLWNFLPDLNTSLSDTVTKLPGIEIKVTEDCIGCGDCIDGCFVNAISMEDDRAVIDDNCRGCARCADTCSHDAIEIIIEDDKSFDEIIEHISSLVDVS